MIRIAAALLAASVLLTAQQALAASSCRPTRDGKDRIDPTNGCPSGYTMRGVCCESLTATPPSGATARTCPPGTVSSLGACVTRR